MNHVSIPASQRDGECAVVLPSWRRDGPASRPSVWAEGDGAGARAENERLRQIIKELQRHRFGRRAESLPEDQLLLGLKEAEQIQAASEEEAERADPAKRRERTAKRRANRGALPQHLPRMETVIEIEDHSCPCCRNGLHRIGEDVSERRWPTGSAARLGICARCTSGCWRS
ncbi:hypothetical protein [Mesorhizobium sp.]|uniref:IS66 family transposase n=1 Tax=Mesorhizobium sp. TaxID=1871066 RepID=UPI00257E0635|nr:hypothetical protein [Mesorhizobium sp.]